MKYFHIAITKEQQGKYYAFMLRVSESDNILYKLAEPGMLHANVYNTRKKCNEVVQTWNDSYKRNGTYLFN